MNMKRGISPLLTIALFLITITIVFITYYLMVSQNSYMEPIQSATSMKINDWKDYNIIYVGYIGSESSIEDTYVFLDVSGAVSMNHNIYVHIGDKFRLYNGVMYQLISFHEGIDKISYVDVLRLS